MSRILLFTGKGGVGKTTCAAATALLAAERGMKTLVLSSDPAHSLADAFDEELAPEPLKIRENLFAQEVDLYYSMKKYWGNMRELMLTVFRRQGVDQVAAEELAALPGMNEGSVLLWLDQFYEEGDYELIVVDSAPTGETLTLLSLPQVSQWWLSKAFPLQRFAMKSVGFGMRVAAGIPLDKGLEELDELFSKLERIQSRLSDSEVTSVRLVMNPEKMVIQEAKRAYTYLQLYGYGVDAVIVNRILPDEVEGTTFGKYLEAQRNYLDDIEQSFSPLPILRVPHLGEEVFGLDLLRTIGCGMYEDGDPAATLHKNGGFELNEDGDGYLMQMRLPFVEEGVVEVRQFGDEIVLQIENQRRNIVLPKFLSYYTLADTEISNGKLSIRFEPEKEAGV